MDTLIILFLLVNILYATYRKWPHQVVGGMKGAWQVLTFPFHTVAFGLLLVSRASQKQQHARRRTPRHSPNGTHHKGRTRIMDNEDVKALGMGVLDRTVSDPRSMACSVRAVKDGLLFSYRNGKSEKLNIDGWTDVTDQYVMFQPRSKDNGREPY